MDLDVCAYTGYHGISKAHKEHFMLKHQKFGPHATKPVFRVSDKVRLKIVCCATVSSYHIEAKHVTRLAITFFQIANNNDVDKTARVREMLSAFAVHMAQRQIFSRSDSNIVAKFVLDHTFEKLFVMWSLDFDTIQWSVRLSS